jgi:hypothetical protein
LEPLCVVNNPADRGLDRSVSSRRAHHGALDVRAASVPTQNCELSGKLGDFPV